MLDLTIVVPCRNEVNHIQPFLDSLFQQDLSGITWEALIADGASSDGTAERLAALTEGRPNIRVVNNPERFVSNGLNRAIRMAEGEFIIRMDVHAVYAPDYCRMCLQELKRTGAENVGGPARTVAKGSLARAIAAAYHSPFSTGGARFHDEGFEGWVDTVPFGCWKKTTLERLGLFDESLVRNQDDELNLRITRSGGKIWQTPAIRCWYSPRPSLSALFRQYYQYGFWKVAVIRKHRLPASWRHLAPAAFLLLNAAGLVLLPLTYAGTMPELFRIDAALCALMNTAYFLVLMAASLLTARNSEGRSALYLPAAFATFHISYGLGFLVGLRTMLTSPDGFTSAKSTFTKLSR